MARILVVAVMLVLLAAPAASAFTEPIGKLAAGSQETAVRLHDLPPGYRLGSEGVAGRWVQPVRRVSPKVASRGAI